jgi:hypothetical protein
VHSNQCCGALQQRRGAQRRRVTERANQCWQGCSGSGSVLGRTGTGTGSGFEARFWPVLPPGFTLWKPALTRCLEAFCQIFCKICSISFI